MKLKKRKNKFQFKRKLVVLSTLILLMVLGVGYSYLSENLSLRGNINLKSKSISTVALLDTGINVNNKMKQITSSEEDNYSIHSIKRSSSIPDKLKMELYISIHKQKK